MQCNICGKMLQYMGGDCYACPIHGWDWMMSAQDWLKQEFDLNDEETQSAIRTSQEVTVKV